MKLNVTCEKNCKIVLNEKQNKAKHQVVYLKRFAEKTLLTCDVNYKNRVWLIYVQFKVKIDIFSSIIN